MEADRLWREETGAPDDSYHFFLGMSSCRSIRIHLINIALFLYLSKSQSNCNIIWHNYACILFLHFHTPHPPPTHQPKLSIATRLPVFPIWIMCFTVTRLSGPLKRSFANISQKIGSLAATKAVNWGLVWGIGASGAFFCNLHGGQFRRKLGKD